MKCLKFVLLAVISLFMVGCTAAQRGAATDTASMEWRLKSLEESFLNFREQQRQMADEVVQDRDKTDARLDALEAKMGVVKEDVTDESPTVAESKGGEQGWMTDLPPEEEGWVEGPKPPEKSMAESPEEKPWAKVPAPPAPQAAADPAPKMAPAPKPAMAKKSSPQALYDMGYSQYNADKFPTARATFDEFLAQYPKDKLAANALYWKGETYYSEKNYAQAILTFKEVTGQFPKHPKAAAALLKIGMSYDRVGDKDNAKFYLRALMEDFPKSDAASIGRKELKRLGG